MRILIVDDHHLFREGLRFLLHGLDEGLLLDNAGDCAEAFLLVSNHRYDLILLDLKLPGKQDLDALVCMRDACVETPVVVLSGEESPRIVRSTIELGAMGYIPKSSTPEILIQALRLVLAGGVYLPPRILLHDSADDAPPANMDGGVSLGLTPRQMEVLRCVIQGKTNKVIARELDISEATIKAHLSTVLRVLGVSNRTEAVYAAARLGLKIS